MRLDPDLVRWLREDRGLSVNKLAKLSGLPVDLVVAIEEGGHRGSPDSARKLASGLSCAGHGEPVLPDDLWLREDLPS
jgi:transcriptional regulator with XRE-family HTH domain